MKLKTTLILLYLVSSCATTMNIEKLSYNGQLKKIEIADIPVNTSALDDIPPPYFKEYSGHESAAARNYKSYDTFGFRDALLQQVSRILNDTVLRLMLITPREDATSYDAFAYLAGNNIVALHFSDTGNFKQWMDIAFQKKLCAARRI